MRFRVAREGRNGWSEWITPFMKGYRIKCCDCGLVHEFEFRALEQVTPETKRHTWQARVIRNGRISYRARRAKA